MKIVPPNSWKPHYCPTKIWLLFSMNYNMLPYYIKFIKIDISLNKKSVQYLSVIYRYKHFGNSLKQFSEKKKIFKQKKL